MAADANAPVKLGAIAASIELYNAGQIDDKFARLANGMICMGSKPNLEAIQAVEEPKVGWFYNALDTDINYVYVEEEKLVKTEDAELDAEKIYYTSEGEEVAEPDVANIAEYYEYQFVGRWDKVGGVFQLPAYLDNSALEAKYLQINDLSSYLASYVTSTSLESTLADYVTTTALSTTLEGYVTTNALSTTLEGYVTTSGLSTALSGYTATSELATWLANAGFIDSTAIETWISGKNFATVSQLPSEQASNVQALQQKFAAFATLTNMVDRTDVTVYELYDLIYEIATKLGYEPPAGE